MTFRPGESGNPGGRPKGSTTAGRVRKEIEEALPDILKSIIAQAKSGDMTAAKILIERVCPSLKPQALPVIIPIAETLDGTGQNVIAETLNGSISPDIGAALITALSNQTKITETIDLIKRIEILEGKNGNN